MKCAALLICAGCNSWFGLDATHEVFPDAIDAPPLTATVNVVYRVGLTSGATGSTSDVAIPGATMQANGVAAPYDGQGNVTVPQAIVDAPWRLDIAAPGETPIQLQWMPAHGEVCLPRWGRLDRPPLVGDNHIYMTANAAGLEAPQILTSGVWTQTALSSTSTNVDLFFTSTIVTPLDGDISPIDSNDWMMLVDYSKSTSDPGLHESTKYARVPAQLNPSPPVPVNLTGTFIPKMFTVKLPDLTASNLFSMAGVSASTGYAASAGYAASSNMLAQPLEGGAAKLFKMAMYDRDPGGAFTAIETDLMLPHFVQVRRISHRAYSGVGLDSAVERVDLGSTSAYPDGPSNAVPVAIATDVHLDDLALDTDGVMATAPTADATLRWTNSTGTADLAVVTVYEVLGTSLAPVKQLVTTGSSVAIPQALLVKGHDYVFEITLRIGFPNAAAGDLCTLSWPMFDTQLFTAVTLVR